MKVLLAAGAGRPPFEGEQWLEAASALGLEAYLLDLDASRDPTLSLPTWTRRTAAEVVLVLSGRRIDPGTIDLVRRLGARVGFFAVPNGEPERARWLAGAADAVAKTAEEDFGPLVDRLGRRAEPLDRGAHLPAPSPGIERSATTVIVRAPGDRFVASAAGPSDRRRWVGIGGRADLPRWVERVAVSSLEEMADRLHRADRLLGGGRPPGTFEPTTIGDEALAAAAGLEWARLAFLAEANKAEFRTAEPRPLAEVLRRFLELLP